MNTNTLVRLALIALLPPLLLGACRSGRPANCPKPGLYTEAQSVPPLRIPTGLQAPDTRGALRIPDLNEPEVPLPKTAPCIDSPPKFSNSARLEPAAPARKNRWWRRDRAPAEQAPPPAAPSGGSTTGSGPARP